jgi:predicted acetyltransferase
MEIAAATDADYGEAFAPLEAAFGFRVDPDWIERRRPLLPPERMLVARVGGVVAGCAAALPLSLTVPGGGEVAAAGVTMVAVLPTHTRRGILTRLVERQLVDARERGDALAVLWASEGSIYGRFGFGLATLSCDVELERDRGAFATAAPREGEIRLLDRDEAALVLAPIYERIRRVTPGMYGRSAEWWSRRSLEEPEFGPGTGSPLNWAVLLLDGNPCGYATYRLDLRWDAGSPAGTLQIYEALANSARATRELWEYLLAVDLVRTVRMRRLPPDHPLVLSLADPARLRLRVGDGLWLRVVDVEAALSVRERRDGDPVVFELADLLCPWNSGRWRVGQSALERTDAEPELRLGPAELGCAYLGAFTFAQLAWAGRAEELVPGALERADRIFRTDRMPWCPEVF